MEAQIRKYGFRWKMRFLWNNGFWPDEQHIRMADWLFDMQDRFKSK
jgi:hypothetical protein